MNSFRVLRTWPALLMATAVLSCADDREIMDPGLIGSPQMATAANQPPVANHGGPYTGFVKVDITFDGRGSFDPEGSALTYLWNFGDGKTATGPTPVHRYTRTGTFTLTLKVTDQTRLSSMVSTTVTVLPPNQAPVAHAGGPYSGNPGTPVQFDGSKSSDPDGHVPLTYLWKFGDGVTITTAEAKPTHTYATTGTFTVTLRVTDAYGKASSQVTTTATITPAANRPPVADAAGPYSGTAGVAVTFSGAGSSDPDGDALTYAWSFGDGSTGTGVTPSHTYASAGNYTVALTVTDVRGLSSAQVTTTTAIAEPPVNRQPVADAAGPYNGTAGVAVTLDGTGSSDPDGDALTYAWSFGDGSTGTGDTPSHTYANAGNYTVALTVTDARGLSSAQVSTTAAIAPPANRQPVAHAGGPYSGSAGRAVSFDGTGSSDPDDNVPLSFAWNFGDGSTGTGQSPSHIYGAAGTYTVTLTVTDAWGLSSLSATAAAQIAPRILILDGFTRNVTSGFGTPDIGNPWRVDPPEFANQFYMGGNRGVFDVRDTLPRKVIGSNKGAAIDTATYGLNVQGLMSFSVDRVPDVSDRAFSVQVYARRNDRLGDGNHHYRFRFRIFGRGTMDASIERQKAGATAIWLADKLPVPGTFVPNAKYWFRWEVFGSMPTTVRMRVWRDGTPEPTTWHAAANNSEPALDYSGTSGIRSWAPQTGQVNWPIQLSIYSFRYSLRD